MNIYNAMMVFVLVCRYFTVGLEVAQERRARLSKKQQRAGRVSRRARKIA